MTSRVVPRKNLFSSLDEMEGDFCLYKGDFEMSDKVIIFDTTLRDGEQAPGCSMNLKEKLAVAHQLARLGVDVIEAGFPVASPGDFEAVEKIATEVKGPTICGLCRANKKDIKVCADAIKNAEKRRIHTFIATSDIHMKFKLKKTPDEVVAIATEAVSYAKTFTDDVEFSCEDAARSEISFLQRIIEAAIGAGATTINLPDTVGYMLPWVYQDFVKQVIEGVPSRDKVIFSVHCHDDLGLAVANSLAALNSGARQIEGSINGIGERAGNAAIEEVVMAIHTRADIMKVKTDINLKEIYNTCQLVSRTTGMSIPNNKSITGKNAFLHESGIHQDGVLKERSTYEIMNPETIGIKVDNLVLGKHSGRHAISSRLETLGYHLTEEELNKTFESFKKLSDKKKEVLDDDLIALVMDKALHEKAQFTFSHLHVFSGTDLTSTATLGIEHEGVIKEVVALGKGPVDAAYEAVDLYFDSILDDRVTLEDFRIGAVTPGQDALGQVRVKISYKGVTVKGTGLSVNILEACTKAYVDAMNRVVTLVKKN